MAKWGEWFQKLGAAIIDGGDALLPVGKVITSNSAVTDGPFIEAKELVGGYSIVEADSIDHAAEMAKGCPVLTHGGNVEVRQLAGYSDSL
ncbi:MAG: YciI family protein [Pirellulaceae bacterium]